MNLCKLATSLLIVLFLATISAAHDEQAAVHAMGDYKAALDHFQKWHANIDSADFYNDVEFTDAEGKKRLFKDMPEIDKRLFYLWQGQTLSNHMAGMQDRWKDELQSVVLIPPPDVEPDPDPNKRPATAEDIAKFQGELLKLRKKHAVRFESLIKDVFDKVGDRVTKQEKEYYLKEVQKWHDKNKLIDRD